jgi:putative transcription factor
MPFTKRVSIEGTIMRACAGCAKFGRDLDSRAQVPSGAPAKRITVAVSKPQVRDIYKEIGDAELVDDMGARIRKARTTRGLKQDDLGKLINERKSVIESLENGRMHPDDKLVAKLEKVLGIKLKEKVVETPMAQKGTSSGLTLGDILKTAK